MSNHVPTNSDSAKSKFRTENTPYTASERGVYKTIRKHSSSVKNKERNVSSAKFQNNIKHRNRKPQGTKLYTELRGIYI